jgi:cellobiose phosphorylase
VALGVGTDQIAWEGSNGGIRHRVTLHLRAHALAWLWRVEVPNTSDAILLIDAILVQDLGLGMRGFVANSEAYASQYIDQHVARNARYGPVVMSRQNLQQDGKHRWVMQGCLDGATAFATNALQVCGWRVCSSGPGLYVNLLIRHALGIRRAFGARVVAPVASNARLWSPDQSVPTTQ